MKRVLLSLLAFLPFALVYAQNCDPNMAYADSVGVFPFPYDPVESPDGGINECAVIGENFEFTFTIVVGDSITAEVFGSEVTLPLDKVRVDSVQNLPEGIAVLCEPQSCEFESGTIGCAKLTGVPTSANVATDYELKIFGTAFFPVLPFQYPLTFPGILAEGSYTLRLLNDPGEPCHVVSTNEFLKDHVSMTTHPNPTSGWMNVEINTRISGEFDLQIVDLLGQTVYAHTVDIREGLNRFTIDGSSFANGLHLMVLKNEMGIVARKITIQH